MELVPGGNLAERIYDRNKRRMSYIEILQVMRTPSEKGPGFRVLMV